jgi:hypothetical protein
MTIAQAFNDITVAQGGTPSKGGTITGAIDALNDTLAGSDQKPAQTIEGAIRLLGAHIGGGVAPSGTIEITENGEGIDVAQYAYADVSVSGGGGAQTTDVYLWNMTGNVVPSKVEYVSGYSDGNPTYTELETEGITNELGDNTVYGIKVKDCPAGRYLNYTLPSGYTFSAEGSPNIGYSAVLFPAMPGVSTCAMIPIDGMYQVAPFVVMTVGQ